MEQMTENKKMLDALERGIAMMQNQPLQLKEQYLAMLIMLTECFVEDAEAGCVMVFKPDAEKIVVCAANITEAETMWALESALEGVIERATEHAPPKEMFN
jgi:hypothetical protein